MDRVPTGSVFSVQGAHHVRRADNDFRSAVLQQMIRAGAGSARDGAGHCTNDSAECVGLMSSVKRTRPKPCLNNDRGPGYCCEDARTIQKSLPGWCDAGRSLRKQQTSACDRGHQFTVPRGVGAVDPGSEHCDGVAPFGERGTVY